MTIADATLWTVFFGKEQNAEERTERILADVQMKEVRQQLHGMPVSLIGGFRSSLDDGLRSLLSVSVRDVIAGGWNTYTELKEYKDVSKHPPDEANVVYIKEHTITSSHRPHLELRMGQKNLASVEIGIELALQIEAVALTVSAGRIREVRPGACTASGTVKCGQATLAHRESEPITLPGVITVN